ncbi:amino acid transporter [Haladaptatus paucihalophilus DX253]|uniref:Amino acid transporter n=1 Tax=Haladaptatus paucihalophilus DX253 TaxID=797209 RepID=E7QZS2_HALPU|nr:amino acid permease [Haladaptatus paucihalophilus]EFW89816.1 amino acid transporter [Haladaptatus paucihalophilus DX253]SHK55163.1 cationic amino acid:proton symporter, ABT family [Haladaptatus paucihalophilus DX253]
MDHSSTEAEAGGGSTGDGSVETELSRDMSLFDITFIGVGAMIGAGVFALTGFAAGIAGPALTIAFIINGFVAMFTAVSYAELGAAFPEAGGGYLWVKEALVDPNGFYAGWMSWFAHAVACALYAVTFGTFFVEFLRIGFGLPTEFALLGFITPIMAEKGLAALVVVAFAYINFRGAEETGKAGVIVTGIKVVILGIFVAFGLTTTFNNPNWTAKFLDSPSFAPNGFIGIVGAMGFTYIAFEGYEIIVQSGEEVVNPGKNVPKAVFYSMAIVVPIYVLVAFAAIGGITPTADLISKAAGVSGSAASVPTWELLGGLGELGIIEAAGQFVPYGAFLLLFAGLAATMSALNATVYSSSRVSFAMGRDRALPAFFDRIHPDKRTPHWAILLSGILIILMAISLPIESVAASADLMFILLFVQVNWTVIRMRQTHPDLPRTYKVPYMPWPPLIGIGLQFLLTPFLVYELGLKPGIGPGSEGFVALITTAVWMIIGLGVYYGYSKQKEAEQMEEETPTVVTERVPSEADNQIVVPIANPESAPQLMRTATDIARDRNGEILVMSIVTVPQQTPLSEGRKFIDDQRNVLDEAMAIAEDEDVPVSGTIRIGHDVSKAILNTVEQYDSDAVLMGWKGQHKSQRRDIVLGSNVDEVVQNADCDVLVERIGPDEGAAESILVPTAGGPHAELAAEVADNIARSNGATVEVIHVVGPDASESERANAQTVLDEAKDDFSEGTTVTTELLTGDDVIDTIVERTGEHDLTIIGATREGLLQQFVFGALPEQVGWRSKSTIIMAKRNLGITSRLSRWLR